MSLSLNKSFIYSFGHVAHYIVLKYYTIDQNNRDYDIW